MKDAIIYAGYSRDKSGVMRFRTATTQKRVEQLEALGEEVHMRIINDVYTKSAAAKELLRLDHANGVAELEAFYTAQVRDENPFKAKQARTVTIKKSELTNEPKMSAKEAAKVRAEFNARVNAAYEAN
jgi:3-deoxy-D-manno-octulosonic acid (KDO) 8-phosphate synthase